MNKKNSSFESALKKLESTVEKLEEKKISLDKSVSYFEDGIKQMKICEEHLMGAKSKFTELIKGSDGEFIEELLGDELKTLFDIGDN